MTEIESLSLSQPKQCCKPELVVLKGQRMVRRRERVSSGIFIFPHERDWSHNRLKLIFILSGMLSYGHLLNVSIKQSLFFNLAQWLHVSSAVQGNVLLLRLLGSLTRPQVTRDSVLHHSVPQTTHMKWLTEENPTRFKTGKGEMSHRASLQK